MDIRLSKLACMAVIGASLVTSACAGHEARDFSGRWAPVNKYAEHTEAIPLRGAYVFQASPMDRTLRTLLARWARDSGAELDYRHPSDFTLHQPVRAVRAYSIADAVAQLDSAFGLHGVVMRMEGHRLVVAAGGGGEG
ncbi:hypothetical protein [Luteimonas terricola]|uniref:Toxin co-regulated pilus biosynthesis protein Q C-terminal domain-containing protein n=1 Tax=Luteimonas terricola TaxID=645597 RepID=A0ABQ2E8Z8_9GAMM|nr:hypothetical protein [Luteimonas terricola]GGK01342.1 hypothetical protein GCM10011394_08210 [Luteimonas terricola]